jgi:hypothetical protein
LASNVNNLAIFAERPNVADYCLSAIDGTRLGIQAVNATHEDCTSKRSVADEAATPDLLHRGPESVHVGALAEGESSSTLPSFLIGTTVGTRDSG